MRNANTHLTIHYLLPPHVHKQTLGDEHLLCLNGSEKETDTTLSSSTSKDNDEDESVKSNESCIDMERSGDVEEGSGDVNVVVICNEGDMTLDDSKQTTADDNAVEYTHVSLPLPGCDVTGIDICSIETAQECGRQEEGKRLELSSVDPSLIQSGVNDESETGETSQTEPVTITNNPNSQPQTVLKRSVPISCAICLLEYEKGDRVCWSSNAECSHVFHEDCILQWLVSLGKKSPINQYLYYTRNPRDKELLNDELCPCCRQDFICVKPASLGSEERV